MRTERLLRIELTVSDLDAAAAFYAALPGISVGERDQAEAGMVALLGVNRIDQVRLQRGDQVIVLQQFDPPGRPYPANPISCDQGFQHFALPVPDATSAIAGLPASAVPISRDGAQRLPASSGGATAFKFRDPDGHPLELIQFADGRPGGIDHSAIVSADAERSIAFYRDQLGFTVAGRQTNQGSEQDRLDGLTNTIVEVVALQPAVQTPHVELLAYRSPPVRPAVERFANDIAATRLVFAVDRLSTPGVQLADGSQIALIRDPDGHMLLLHGPE